MTYYLCFKHVCVRIIKLVTWVFFACYNPPVRWTMLWTVHATIWPIFSWFAVDTRSIALGTIFAAEVQARIIAFKSKISILAICNTVSVWLMTHSTITVRAWYVAMVSVIRVDAWTTRTQITITSWIFAMNRTLHITHQPPLVHRACCNRNRNLPLTHNTIRIKTTIANMSRYYCIPQTTSVGEHSSFFIVVCLVYYISHEVFIHCFDWLELC